MRIIRKTSSRQDRMKKDLDYFRIPYADCVFLTQPPESMVTY